MKRKYLIYVLIAGMVLGNTPQAEAKAKKPKLSISRWNPSVGDWKRIYVRGVNPKQTKWTLSRKGKSILSLKKKKKKSVVVKAKKAGTATLIAKVKVKGKKTKTLRAKIKVGKKQSSVTVVQKKQPDFTGKVSASLTDTGYVRVSWTKMPEAHSYVVQRKTGNGTWENVKVTASLRYTDTKVEDNTTYFYRLRGNCNKVVSKYSKAIEIKTGTVQRTEVTNQTYPIVTPDPSESDDAWATPEPTPEPTPYKAKYSYEVEVLNRFNIYQEEFGGFAVLYIKTDNPNPNGGTNGVEINIKGIDGWWNYDYEDVQYEEQEDTNSTLFNKVKGGWIYTCAAEKPGTYTVSIQEDTGVNSERYVWETVDTFQIEVKDGEKSLQEHCNNIIKTVSDATYNKDGRGKWDDLSMPDKMERLEDYVRGSLHYPRIGPATSLGYLPVWIIQENVGAFWETGFADCGAANEMMCVLARTLGLEAERKNTVMGGMLHIVASVTIDGTEYTYDATPYQGGYKDWDYIL